MSEKSKSKRFEITNDKQLKGYLDNYHKCNNCRLADWATHPTLFKPASLVFKPRTFHNEAAKKEIEGLPDKRFSSYCRACSLGRTIKRNIAEGKEITCKAQYMALIADWSKQTKLTYCYNVFKSKDGTCKASIPTEIALQGNENQDLIDENEELKAQIKQLEDERDEVTDQLTQEEDKYNKANHAYDKVHNYNMELLNQISDLQAEIADHKADVTEMPENNQKIIQDIYDRIFAHKSKRSWKSSYWRLEQDNFQPLYDNLKNLGATTKKGH